LSSEPVSAQPGQSRTVPFVYRDEYLVVIDKPAGLLVHPHSFDWRSPTCISIVERMTGRRVYTVHRLDRGTSGLVILALDPVTATALSMAFRERRIHKEYLALVRGFIGESGRIDSPISRRPGKPAAPALTLYKPLAQVELPVPIGPHPSARYTLLSLELATGRSHQARRHLHRINHPVIGDKQHGDRDHNRYYAERFGREFLFLRATRIQFTHPHDGSELNVQAALPDFWNHVLEEIGMAVPERMASGEGTWPTFRSAANLST